MLCLDRGKGRKKTCAYVACERYGLGALLPWRGTGKKIKNVEKRQRDEPCRFSFLVRHIFHSAGDLLPSLKVNPGCDVAGGWSVAGR